MKTKKYHNGSISSVHFHFPEAFLLFISSSDLPRGVGLCLFPVTSSKRIHWIPLVITPTWTYNISSGLTNLNWKWKYIDQNVQKPEVLEKIPLHFDINLFSERLEQFSLGKVSTFFHFFPCVSVIALKASLSYGHFLCHS